MSKKEDVKLQELKNQSMSFKKSRASIFKEEKRVKDAEKAEKDIKIKDKPKVEKKETVKPVVKPKPKVTSEEEPTK